MHWFGPSLGVSPWSKQVTGQGSIGVSAGAQPQEDVSRWQAWPGLQILSSWSVALESIYRLRSTLTSGLWQGIESSTKEASDILRSITMGGTQLEVTTVM